MVRVTVPQPPHLDDVGDATATTWPETLSVRPSDSARWRPADFTCSLSACRRPWSATTASPPDCWYMSVPPREGRSVHQFMGVRMEPGGVPGRLSMGPERADGVGHPSDRPTFQAHLGGMLAPEGRHRPSSMVQQPPVRPNRATKPDGEVWVLVVRNRVRSGHFRAPAMPSKITVRSLPEPRRCARGRAATERTGLYQRTDGTRTNGGRQRHAEAWPPLAVPDKAILPSQAAAVGAAAVADQLAARRLSTSERQRSGSAAHSRGDSYQI